jgi:hypothetical protein
VNDLSHPSSRRRNQVKGALFEIIVRILLVRAGYKPIKRDGISVRRSDGNVRGRGYWHDVDALGRFAYPLLYMYPIRLLAEAKCYDRNVPISAVRNFFGALKDISENYFVEDKMSREEMLSYIRYTDCGSFFSASGFTLGAQKFALAQGVFLISYENNPILGKVVDSMNRLIGFLDVLSASRSKADFEKWMSERLTQQFRRTYRSRFVLDQTRDDFTTEFNHLHRDLNSIQTSAIAMAVGQEPSIQYPIHMLSYERIPDNVFIEKDDHLFRVYYTETRRGLFFRVVPAETRPPVNLLFSLPRHIYTRYFAERRMIDFKMKFLNHIELPTTIGGLRRILRLNLDQEWVRRQHGTMD